MQRDPRQNKTRKKRNNNKTVNLYIHSNTYLPNLFAEFRFSPINIDLLAWFVITQGKKKHDP